MPYFGSGFPFGDDQWISAAGTGVVVDRFGVRRLRDSGSQHALTGWRFLMPEIATKYFGSIEYQPDAAIRFPAGLPGFEEELEFLVLEHPETSPMVFLQSLRRASLCFLALPIQVIAPDYALATTSEDLDSLGFPPGARPAAGVDVTCLTIIVVAENGRISANLLAPILINPARRLGLQAIRADSVYSHQHPVGAAACS